MKAKKDSKLKKAIIHKPSRVLVFGTFDILHPGHLYYLEEAKKYGDELCVIVARDETVRKVKGRYPVMDELNRVKLINALKVVDRAVLGCKGDIYARVRELEPDIICLGYDQQPPIEELRNELEKVGMQVEMYRIKPFKPEQLQSTKIKQKVIEAQKKKE